MVGHDGERGLHTQRESNKNAMGKPTSTPVDGVYRSTKVTERGYNVKRATRKRRSEATTSGLRKQRFEKTLGPMKKRGDMYIYICVC